MLAVFVLGYCFIALEHPVKINKTATALVLGVVIWTIYVLAGPGIYQISHSSEGFDLFKASHPEALHPFIEYAVDNQLLEHLGDISEILFFLMGAMTIVEVVDRYQGFRIITDKIKTQNITKLLWILGTITFFLSAVLDNLTTTIVMIALLRKLIGDKKQRWFFAGIIVIAANAGGAWSPIGDVTTIMLWIGNKISTDSIILHAFIPSLISLLIPLVVVSFFMKGKIDPVSDSSHENSMPLPMWQRNLVFIVGIGSLLFVPIFKTITHLKPYMGILLALGILWIVTEILYSKNPEKNRDLRVANIISRIDISSILFFLGILLAVAGLQSAGHLSLFATQLDQSFNGNYYLINIIIGMLSAIVDNVPLVAGAMGMYDMGINDIFWLFLSYCAGTGGSILIIGSAAGVAAMGMEKIDFIWYLKKITPYALLGYFAGAGVFILMNMFIF